MFHAVHVEAFEPGELPVDPIVVHLILEYLVLSPPPFVQLDDSGNFIEAPLKQHVRIDLVQDAWQQDAANDIVELCNIEVRRVDPRESPSPSAKCRSTSLRLFNCVWREMIKACPRHLQSNSIACLRMRQNMHNYEDVNEDAYPYPYVGHGGGFPSRDSRIN